MGTNRVCVAGQGRRSGANSDRQPMVCRGRSLDRPNGLSMARLAEGVREMEYGVHSLLQMASQRRVGASVHAVADDAEIKHVLIDSTIVRAHQHSSGARMIVTEGQQSDIAVRLLRPGDAQIVARRVGSLGVGIHASVECLNRYGMPDSLEALRCGSLVGLLIKFLPTVASFVLFCKRPQSAIIRPLSISADIVRNNAMRFTGECRCGHVQLRISTEKRPPVYACHCLNCQRSSGSAFGLHMLCAAT